MRSSFILFALLVALLSLSWAPTIALAQPSPKDDPAQNPKKALLAGQKLLEQGQFQEALDLFQKGYQTFQDPEFILSSGYAYLKLQRFQEAKDSFDEYLRLVPKSKNKSKILPLLADLETIVNTRIKVASTPTGATAWLDSKDNPQLGVTPFEVSVSPGEHTLILQKAGYALTQLPFEAKENQTASLSIPLNDASVRLSLSTTPSGAEVFVDGVSVGVTPLTVEVGSGKRLIVAKKAGFGDLIFELNEKSGKEVQRSEKLPSSPAVVIFVNPTPGAALSIDDKSMGPVPERISLASGKHTIVISAKGFRSLERRVELSPNQEFALDAELKPPGLEFSLRVNLPDAKVSINGDLVGTTPINKSFNFGPKQRPTIEISREGYNSYRQKLPAKDGVYLLDVTLKKEGLAGAPLAVFGLAAAATGGGAFFGVKALQNDDIFAQTPSPELLALIQRQAVLSDVGFGLGLAGVVGGVILLKKSGGLKGSPGKLTSTLAVMPSLGGAIASLQF